eukprot:TRINITY_DN4324_c0_g1_i1.p1 TRINITY_DN4324_c0_g1~~TRINITY_DN4324_c0_g1_i1.p1  ORF type:complete len:342 (+),score=72.10 TRINITY_DN4324_c0_g1_i1:143-1168(+)
MALNGITILGGMTIISLTVLLLFLQHQNAQLRTEILTSRNAVMKTKSMADFYKTLSDKHLTRIREEQNSRTSEVDKLTVLYQESIRELEGKYAELEREKQAREETLETCQETEKNVKDENEELRKKINSQQLELAEMEFRIESHLKEHGEFDKKAEMAASNAAILQDRIRELEAKYDELSKDCEVCEDSLEGCQENEQISFEELHLKDEEIKQQAEKTASSAALSQKTIDNLKAKYDELSKDCEICEDSLESCQENEQNAFDEFHVMNDELSQMSGNSKQCELYKKQADQASKNAALMQDTINDLTEKYDNLLTERDICEDSLLNCQENEKNAFDQLKNQQ